MPVILTVSPRSLGDGGVEWRDRSTGERQILSVDEVDARLTGRAAAPA